MRVVTTLLFFSVEQLNTMELAENHVADKQEDIHKFVDKVVDKLVDNLYDQMLKASLLHYEDLDNTNLAKPSHLAGPLHRSFPFITSQLPYPFLLKERLRPAPRIIERNLPEKRRDQWPAQVTKAESVVARAATADTEAGSSATSVQPLSVDAVSSLYDLSAMDIDDNMVSLDFTGKISVVVNVADDTECSGWLNYEMLKRMQEKYTDAPVQFLLFPGNQKGGTNAEIKTCAEKYVSLGSGSKVIIFAKSNVNAGEPESAECCLPNNSIYRYLLAKTPPHKIKKDFEKIIVDQTGVPHPVLLSSQALDPELSKVIDKLLKKANPYSKDVALM